MLLIPFLQSGKLLVHLQVYLGIHIEGNNNQALFWLLVQIHHSLIPPRYIPSFSYLITAIKILLRPGARSLLAVYHDCIIYENCIPWLNGVLVLHRFGNLIRLTKDGFLWQSWLWLQTKVTRFMLLRGRKILEGNELISKGTTYNRCMCVTCYNFQNTQIQQIPI